MCIVCVRAHTCRRWVLYTESCAHNGLGKRGLAQLLQLPSLRSLDKREDRVKVKQSGTFWLLYSV